MLGDGSSYILRFSKLVVWLRSLDRAAFVLRSQTTGKAAGSGVLLAGKLQDLRIDAELLPLLLIVP